LRSYLSLIKKFTVAWLLGLFVWNVALAGVPSLWLCLHADFLIHLESEGACDTHCEEAQHHAAAEETELCVIAGDCTDLELVGGELISARLNEVEAPVLPIVAISALSYPLSALRVFQEHTQLRPPSRAPPSVHWLTDIYIKKTVLRV
jgi:hypothetical protein